MGKKHYRQTARQGTGRIQPGESGEGRILVHGPATAVVAVEGGYAEFHHVPDGHLLVEAVGSAKRSKRLYVIPESAAETAVPWDALTRLDASQDLAQSELPAHMQWFVQGLREHLAKDGIDERVVFIGK